MASDNNKNVRTSHLENVYYTSIYSTLLCVQMHGVVRANIDAIFSNALNYIKHTDGN